MADPVRCRVCGFVVDGEGNRESGYCFLHVERAPLLSKFGGKDLPVVGPGWDHRIFAETKPDELSELYATTGMTMSFQEWHDTQAPMHNLCSNCDPNRAFAVLG